jgi:tRNA dimethylallyltransferase
MSEDIEDNLNQKYLIVVAGPTASGKTGLGIRLAKHFGTVILSADSRQFYQEMSIGTAKPTPEELAAVPHHFVNSLSVHDEYSVGDYEREAIALLDRLFREKDVVLMVGGSGLFIRAVLQGIDEFPDVPLSVREAIQEELKEEGMGHLQAELQKKDPYYYQRMDIHNPHRLIRALSVIRVSGQPFSAFLGKGRPQRGFRPIIINLAWERPELYDRINCRVDLMMAAGQEAEARSLYPLRHLNSLQTVGYQELFDYFEGKTDLADAVELIKRNSRRYAKRQMTWFRKVEGAGSFHPSDWKGILAHIQGEMRNNPS